MIKHDKNLPYWWDIKDSLAAPKNQVLPSQVDLAVVGGGFAGMSAALTAAEAGLSVILFDEGQPGRAASTRNGGICSGHLRIPHSVLAKECGVENADSVYGEAAIAREDLAGFITQYDIQCDYRQAGHFTGALSPADFEAMKREIDALQAIPGIDASLIENALSLIKTLNLFFKILPILFKHLFILSIFLVSLSLNFNSPKIL